eukprot:SAG31_NODE_29634_length_392_cov_0.822526_2_plen_83_part_01
MVVLAGYKDKMTRLMRADPGLPRRFPMAIDLPNYTSDEIATICSKKAQVQFGLTIEDAETVLPRLAEKIELEHAADMAKQNGG